jgi:hypothetical protein
MSNPAWQKGISGNPSGRTPDALNKKNQFIKDSLKTLLGEGLPRLKDELSKLEGKYYIEAWVSIADFVLPRLQKVNVVEENQKNKVVQVFNLGGQELEFITFEES